MQIFIRSLEKLCQMIRFVDLRQAIEALNQITNQDNAQLQSIIQNSILPHIKKLPITVNKVALKYDHDKLEEFIQSFNELVLQTQEEAFNQLVNKMSDAEKIELVVKKVAEIFNALFLKDESKKQPIIFELQEALDTTHSLTADEKYQLMSKVVDAACDIHENKEKFQNNFAINTVLSAVNGRIQNAQNSTLAFALLKKIRSASSMQISRIPESATDSLDETTLMLRVNALHNVLSVYMLGSNQQESLRNLYDKICVDVGCRKQQSAVDDLLITLSKVLGELFSNQESDGTIYCIGNYELKTLLRLADQANDDTIEIQTKKLLKETCKRINQQLYPERTSLLKILEKRIRELKEHCQTAQFYAELTPVIQELNSLPDLFENYVQMPRFCTLANKLKSLVKDISEKIKTSLTEAINDIENIEEQYTIFSTCVQQLEEVAIEVHLNDKIINDINNHLNAVIQAFTWLTVAIQKTVWSELENRLPENEKIKLNVQLLGEMFAQFFLIDKDKKNMIISIFLIFLNTLNQEQNFTEIQKHNLLLQIIDRTCSVDHNNYIRALSRDEIKFTSQENIISFVLSDNKTYDTSKEIDSPEVDSSLIKTVEEQVLSCIISNLALLKKETDTPISTQPIGACEKSMLQIKAYNAILNSRSNAFQSQFFHSDTTTNPSNENNQLLTIR